MNKIALGTLLVSIGGVCSVAQAANYGQFNVVFNCNRQVLVSISTDAVANPQYTVAFSTLNALTGTSILFSTPIFVLNNSNTSFAAVETFAVYVSTQTGNTEQQYTSWTLTGQADKYALGGAFCTTMPSAATAITNAAGGGGADNNVFPTIPPTNWWGTTTFYHPGTGGTAYAPEGKGMPNTSYYLYLVLNTPLAVSTNVSQTIGLTVLAK